MAEQRAMVPTSTQAAEESFDSPGWEDPTVTEALALVTVCRDVMKGTAAIREKAKVYIMPFEKEPDAVYAARAGSAVLYPAFRRTVKGFSGMAFRSEPKVQDAPPEVEAILDNVDLAGRHFAVFGRDGFEDKVVAGHAAIFVDWHGPTPGEAPNRAAEEAAGARPYWTLIHKDQVRRFDHRMDDGRVVITAFAFEEGDWVKAGEFGRKPIRRMREYTLEGEGADARVVYNSWTRDADSKGEWEPEKQDESLGPRMKRIPLVADYANRTGVLASEPPLLDLAYLNIRHLNVDCDKFHNQRTTLVEMLVTTGVKKDQLETVAVGPTFGLALPEGATVQMLGANGTGQEAARADLQDLEQRMANIGLSMFVRGNYRGPETATAQRDNKAEQDSEAASWLRNSKDAWEEALMLTAMWLGLEEGGTVDVNLDLSIDMPDPQLVAQLSAMVEKGQWPLEWLHALLAKYRDLIPEDASIDDAMDLLAAEGVPELRAAVEANREDADGTVDDEVAVDEMDDAA